jgi:hypothetical protein
MDLDDAKTSTALRS